ncbi:PLDc N-terminal domain-containing protein [Mucilaginibacter paludis]|uniref:Uncharacterized protein n=1 Tax=Mucilaginibacter paludis DSM 18603 TaxID=714943 RepID=H1Y0C3_9SPHI|nr:PLDc N-terminal domain-containing protein [Mucilaginibacter paludis]EHQ28172.1 hypothetical protein Mucpa_4081 [Mucilaginibacter paludis DSM 18603]
MQTSLSSVLINTTLIILLIWLIVLVFSLVSLSRRRDIFTPVKVFWAAIILFAPVAGLVVYLVYGPKKRV